MSNRKADVTHKNIQVWGIKRAEVDIHQLALVYYLLAKRRIEARRSAGSVTALPDREAA